MFNIKGKDSDKYFQEVEDKLIEETNYNLEIDKSKAIAEACKHLPHIKFPDYYEDWSCDRIITMDYMNGLHISEFIKTEFSQETANQLGQALWDFYMFQIHNLKKVHADPHPGNFLVSKDNNLIVLDFGCMKVIPEEFYKPYFELADENNLNDAAFFNFKLNELEILKPEDTQEELDFFTSLFHELLSVFTQPFNAKHFDFSNPVFLIKLKIWENVSVKTVN